MSTATIARESETFADVLERLGGVSPARVRMQPYPASVEDVIRIQQRENRLFELVDGVLVEKAMGFTESRLAITIAAAIERFLEGNDAGVVTGPDGMIRFPSNLVRMPDVAFVPWDQFPNEELTQEAAPEVVPGLAVEVNSSGNTAGEMAGKLREYFAAGVQLVWFVDSKTKTVTVYTSPTTASTISVGGQLDGGNVLPGFELPVAKIFSALQRAKQGKRNGG